MRARWPMLVWFVVVACGAAPGPCERLPGLCSLHEVDLRLDLERAVNFTADLDGDGAAELVTASRSSGLSIATDHERRYFLYEHGAPDAAAADVDADGDLDILFVTPSPPALRVLTNRGGLEFAEGPVVALQGQPYALWVGALAGGAATDVVVASVLGGGVTVFVDGLVPTQHIAVDGDLITIEAGDLDGDELPDLVAADLAGGALFVMRAGAHGFAAAEKIEGGPAPEYLELYDLDGDGALDVLTHGQAGPEVWFHAGDGRGGLAAARGLRVQDQPSEGFAAHRDAHGGQWLLLADDHRVVASEVDHDGAVLRRVLGSQFGATTGVRRDGDAVLAPGLARVERFTLPEAQMLTERWRTGGGSLEPLALGDFDADGEIDLAVAEDSDDVSIYLGGPDERWVQTSGFVVPEYMLSMVAADVTGDGVLDLAIGDSKQSVRIAVGRGDGRFDLGAPSPVAIDPWISHGGFDPYGVGASALAIAESGVEGAYILRFDEAGRVVESVLRATGNVRRLASGDVDHDGRDELIALSSSEDGWSLRIVDTLGERIVPLPGVDVENEDGLAVGDHDGDGAVEVLLIAWRALVHVPDLAADPPVVEVREVSWTVSADQVVVADVDADGHVDLCFCSYGGLGVALGDGAGGWSWQAPVDTFIPECTMDRGPDGRVYAATATDRGVAMFTTGVAPALVRTGGFTAGPDALASMTLADVDANGRTVVVVAGADARGVVVVWGQDGGLPQRATWRETASVAGLAAGPIDASPGDDVVFVSQSRDVGLWGAPPSAWGTTPLHDEHAAAILVRRDGSADIAVLGVIEETALLVTLPAAADGTVGEYVVSWQGSVGEAPGELAAADFDGDGYGDAAVFAGVGQRVYVVWGDATRSWTALELPGDPATVQHIAAADSDGDGAVELIVGRSGRAESVDLRGRTARAPVLLATGSYDTRMVLADVEGDGAIDVFAVHGAIVEATSRSADGDESWHIILNGKRDALGFAEMDGDATLDMVGLHDGRLTVRRATP